MFAFRLLPRQVASYPRQTLLLSCNNISLSLLSVSWKSIIKRMSGTSSIHMESNWIKLCPQAEIPPSGPKAVLVNEEFKVLCCKKNGQIYVTGAKCSHFNVALSSGVQNSYRVRCFAHGAAFNIVTGDVEDYPGCDSLARFPVKLMGDDVWIQVNSEQELKSGRRTCQLACHDAEADKRKFVIVGGGAAGFTALKYLRENGFCGKLTLITAEEYLPYDRIKLNKIKGMHPDNIQMKSAQFYEDAHIELKMSTCVTHLDAKAKSLTLSDGSSISFDKVLIASGCEARYPKDFKKEGHTGVYAIQTAKDAMPIHEALEEERDEDKPLHVVILGNGFIGTEFAGLALKYTDNVTLVQSGELPLMKAFGKEAGEFMRQLHEENGTKFVDNSTVTACSYNENKELVSVTLKDGSIIPADMLVCCVGVTPATDFLKSDLALTPRGHVPVAKDMSVTGTTDVYAAGDIVDFPLGMLKDEHVTIGHWGTAQLQGHIAAHNMLGKGSPKLYNNIPFFWTMQFGKSIRYCGNVGNQGYASKVFHGSISDAKFVVYYLNAHDVVLAGASVGWDPIIAQLAEVMHNGTLLTRGDVQDSADDWVKKHLGGAV